MQKSLKYALKSAKLKNNDSLKKLTPMTFTQNWQNAENNNFFNNSKIANWNKIEIKHKIFLIN